MKRFYLLVFLFLLAFPLSAKNKISMVTYFPVPYVAYSQVNAGQMDIGLTSTCDMKLGCDSIMTPLNAGTVNLKNGRLDLDGGRGIKGTTLTLGNGNGGGQVHFNNVRIQTGNIESVNVDTAMNVTTLNLFDKLFPSCVGANPASNGQMSWQKLKLAGAKSEELYLMCGGFETATCAPTHNGMEVYTGECPSGQTGTVTYTWDPASCKYKESANCEQAPGVNLSIKQRGCPVSWNRYSEEKCQVEASGEYAAGSTVKIKAIPYDPGRFIMDHHKYKFVKWELSSCPGGKIANVNNEETTVTLGNSDCELTANYRNLITFQIGSSLIPALRDDYKEEGYYEPGTTITVVATNNKAPSKEFLYWNPAGNCSSGTVKSTYGNRTATITFKTYDPSQIDIPNCLVYTEFK